MIIGTPPAPAAMVDVMSKLGMQLAIFDNASAAADRDTPNAVSRQVWRGGATDRTTRTMVTDPPRWITLIEIPGPQDSPPPAKALLSWNLEQINPGDRPSPADAGGLVLTSMDIEPAAEDEFTDWYNTEHIPLLSALPGMIAARRFRASRGSPRYVALYHVTDVAIYAKSSWYTANETPWMLRMRRFQSNRTYFMFNKLESVNT
jgi:hypothetical protein